MNVTLHFGTQGLALSLPDSWNCTVVGKKAMPVLPAPEKAVAACLAAPVGCAPLRDLAKGKRSVCVLICDITRPVPNRLLLEPLLAALDEAGVPREGVTILVATGLHRPNEGEELIRVVGSREIVEGWRVVNHFASRDEEHVFLGDTPGGVPVGIDKRFAEAELKIACGLVEPHFMAGFSGGRKVVAPGVCHESTIRAFHNARIMGAAAARNLNLSGNPLHAEQMHIIERLSPVYALNTVIDEDRRLAFVNFGEIAASHAGAVEFAIPYFRVELPRRFRTILTSAAGSPLDGNFYQTVKGLVGAKEALEPGGRIFIASECREGLGSAEFRQCQEFLVRHGWKAFLERIRQRDRAEVDEWETQKLTEILELGSAVLYAPLLPEADRAFTGIGHTDDIVRSMAEWIDAGSDRDVLVIPEGPYVIPTCSA